jgi:hypothetical protein
MPSAERAFESRGIGETVGNGKARIVLSFASEVGLTGHGKPPMIRRL